MDWIWMDWIVLDLIGLELYRLYTHVVNNLHARGGNGAGDLR